MYLSYTNTLTYNISYLLISDCCINIKYGLDAIAEMDGGPEPTNPDGSLYELRNIAYLNATNTTETPASETLATTLTPELSESSETDEPQSSQTTPL
jgi:hypothetical protein